MSTQPNKRALSAIRKLNKIRHSQNKKIDILCNNMVSAHADFVKQLKMLNFSMNTYESLLSQSDLTGLIDNAAGLIQDNIGGSNVAVFLASADGFELHLVNNDSPIDIDAEKLESYFTPEVVQNICKCNWVCTINDMFEMGLEGNLSVLNSISAAAVPLGRFGPTVGFILVYRSADEPLRPDELDRVAVIAPGLCGAIRSFQTAAAEPN